MISTFALLFIACSQSSRETPRTLMAELVKVINSKSLDRLNEFVAAHAQPRAPVKKTAKLWSQTLLQLTPFKIVGDGKQTEDEVDTFATDRDGSRLVFQLHLTHDLKLNGLRVAPAYLVEGPDPAFSNWNSLPELADEITQKMHVPAMGLAVIHDGKLEVATEGIRKLGKPEAVGPDEVWSIGSIGKSICSSVIGRLIELGKLRWDETLGEALSGLTMDPGYRSVTLEQVMHHRGGIPRDSDFTDEDIDAIVGTATAPTDIRSRYARYVLRRPPIAKPGAEFNYSNAGYGLLSVIAERAMGRSYEELVHEFVFKPLDLKQSYTDSDKLPSARPSGHLSGPNGLYPADIEGAMKAMLAGAGVGVFMSVGDLALYGAAHMAGMQGKDGFLKATTIERLHKGIPEIPGGRPYACGWTQSQIPRLQEWDGHNGSDGTMRSELAIFPKANLVVVGIANAGGGTEPAPGFAAVMAIAEKYAPKDPAH
jgi:CubicO group peptidase (beta-lactamase class C family)